MAGHQVTAVAMATGKQQTVLPRKLVLFDVVVRRSALDITNVYIYHLPSTIYPEFMVQPQGQQLAIMLLLLFAFSTTPTPSPRKNSNYIYIFLNVMQADK